MPSRKPLLNFVIEEDLLEKIDTFRFENRFQHRAEAITFLLKWAVNQKPKVKPEDVRPKRLRRAADSEK